MCQRGNSVSLNVFIEKLQSYFICYIKHLIILRNWLHSRSTSHARFVSDGVQHVLLHLWDGLWTYNCNIKQSVLFLLRGDFWGFASDDSRLSSWQSRGLACVNQSNCRRLDKTLSGTLTNPKANCRPDKDKLSFSFLSGSSSRAKFTASSLIPGQSDCMRTEVWWVSGMAVLSCAVTWGHKCNFHIKPWQAFLYVLFMRSSPFSFSTMWCFVQQLSQIKGKPLLPSINNCI